MGDALADEVQRVLAENNLTVDVVIPVRSTHDPIIIKFTPTILVSLSGT